MDVPLQLLPLDPHFSLHRRIIAPTLRTAIGAGAQQVRRRYQRPLYEFTIREGHASPALVRELWGFFALRFGDTPFWFQPGNTWSTIPADDPLLYGYGDGVQTQFYLPNRYLIAGTLQTYTDGVLDSPQPSLDREMGLVTHATAPPLATFPDVTTLTAAYACLYHCVLVEQGEALYSEENFASDLFKAEGLVLRELP